MSCNADELSSFPTLAGCPADDEKFFVCNAVGGTGAGGYAWRTWEDIKACIFSRIDPYIGVVDRGQATDPVSGTDTFTTAELAGLGTRHNGEIQIVLAEVLRSNFGQNATFTYTDNGATGTIVLNSPEEYQAGDSLYVDRNQ